MVAHKPGLAVAPPSPLKSSRLSRWKIGVMIVRAATIIEAVPMSLNPKSLFDLL